MTGTGEKRQTSNKAGQLQDKTDRPELGLAKSSSGDNRGSG